MSLVSCLLYLASLFSARVAYGAFWLHPIPDFEEMSGHTAFSRLHNATITKDDPSSGVGDAKQFFASSLQTLSQSSGGQLRSQLAGAMSAEHVQTINNYCSQFGTAIQ